MKFSLLIFLFFLSHFSFAQTANGDSSIANIRKIFTAYCTQKENTESAANKDLFTRSVKAIKVVKNENDMLLLVNVWMYYDPTDFPSREWIEPVFFNNKSAALKAVNKRIRNRKKWERLDDAPYSDLFSLRAALAK